MFDRYFYVSRRFIVKFAIQLRKSRAPCKNSVSRTLRDGRKREIKRAIKNAFLHTPTRSTLLFSLCFFLLGNPIKSSLFFLSKDRKVIFSNYSYRKVGLSVSEKKRGRMTTTVESKIENRLKFRISRIAPDRLIRREMNVGPCVA